MNGKEVLDPTTGTKSIWNESQRNRDDVLWIDKREEEKGFVGDGHHPNVEISPDEIGDFRDLDMPDKEFNLVVFDPPHKKNNEGMESLTGAIDRKYGALRAETWQHDLKQGFEELWRVLDEGGTLVLKWADNHIDFQDVVDLAPTEPLFGTTTSQSSNIETRWFVFYKPEEAKE